MFRPAHALALLCALYLGVVAPSSMQAATISYTASLPLSATDFGPSNPNLAGQNPLVLQRFDTDGGLRVLDAVNLSFHAMIRSDFGMLFTAPATITDSLATGNTLQPGPAISLYQPDGTTPLLSVQAPSDLTALSRSQTYGYNAGEALPQEFGSQLPTSSPFYLAPAVFDQSASLSLTSPTALADFTGTGTLELPVSATAFASISSSSGNGRGSVSTAGSAEVTVTYQYHDLTPQPQVLPEPASFVLWGVAALALVLLRVRVAHLG
jgi:hypothetical protein